MSAPFKPGLVVVGELNPFGGDPRMALYHLPRGSSGNRLRRIMGLSDAAYEDLEKVNLCEGEWRSRDARERAKYLRGLYPRFVLLGSRVRVAFDGPAPFAQAQQYGLECLGLPHPSGRNLVWNEEGVVERARAALRALAPEIPWGSA